MVAMHCTGQYSRAAEKQYLEKKTFGQRRLPYHGVDGAGGLTFSITETSLGTFVKVKEQITGESIDLTDYDSW
jgi:hypothetical protein